MDEIVKDFLIESGENLDRLDQELVQLETDPRSEPLLASIFRTIHTIKGSCGFLGFTHLEKVTHTGESLLSRLRDHQLHLTPEVTSGLLAMVDAVRRMLAEIGSTEADGDNDYPDLLERLKKLQSAATVDAVPAQSPLLQEPSLEPNPAHPVQAAGDSPQNQLADQKSPEHSETRIEHPLSASASTADQASAPEPGNVGPVRTQVPASAALAATPQRRPTAGKLGGLLVERGRISAEDLALALAEQEHGDQRRVGEILVALGLCKLEDVLAAQQILDARGREAGVETVRVGVKLLDKLMNLVGELVLARNQLLQYANSTEQTAIQSISQHMNLIASELQEEVMKTRMQPIGNVWNKFPRTVRDLALSCGKEVRLEMVGQETELDRTILEAVKDPLTHLVRNAIDHGFESPEVRQHAGKPAAGCLTLRAFHEGGQVNLEISDDGAGLNVERIRQKAIERGLAPRDQAMRMADRDVFQFIFLPGFSTAEKVTNVSGRGVGMDVVRTNLEKIGGSVELQSSPGRGTTVRIKIPLTLAIVPALVVRAAGERFAIPQMSLTELVRLESSQAIENVHGAPVYRLRGQLLPLVNLRSVLYPGSGHGTAGAPVEAARGPLLDFATAREKHLAWLTRLENMLNGKASLSVEQAGSCRECALGQWLYGSGMKDFGDVSEMKTLEQTHRRFHELVREIVTAKAAGFDRKAREAFAGVAPMTRQIVELLTAMENVSVRENKGANIAVLQAGSRRFGLVVDDILDTEEIVVKPLGKQLKGIAVYVGATIMGDGSVALILDVNGVAERAGLLCESAESGQDTSSAADRIATQSTGERSLLVAESGPAARIAIPLELVSRLEEFPASVIERAGSQEVMQYRGQIIPLLRLSGMVSGAGDNSGSSQTLQVVVYSEAGRTVGLVVDRIVDIVDATTEVTPVNRRPGVTGTCVVAKKVTDLLDVPAIVRNAIPGFLEAPQELEPTR